MVLKRSHSQAEIEELARTFRETWSEGQVIRSWLRSHSEELRKLVREEDWSWANIGKALSRPRAPARLARPTQPPNPPRKVTHDRQQDRTE